MQDRRLARISRQLGSVVVVLSAAANEAETLQSQDLADDLHEHLLALKQIYANIGSTGQTYKRNRTTVRN